MPSPRKVMTKGPALVEEFDVVVKTPADVGVKRNVYWQLAPGATPAAQFCVAVNCGSGGMPPAKLVSVIAPVLVIVTVCGGLVNPTPTGPKLSSSGVTHLSLAGGGPAIVPLPCNAIWKLPALVEELEVVEKTPVAAGWNLKVYWQLAPGATPPAQF